MNKAKQNRESLRQFLFRRHDKTSHEILTKVILRGFSIHGKEPTGDPGLRTKGQRLAPMWFAAWCEGTAQIPAIVNHSLHVVLERF